ncbi:uncharacterized protein LOC125028303 [Penaeus chinensis]|uniref:uncharacterized protein LOC125028303 n=1 Tax=Penaeus chinensis TaxID=139456 RepID=UPI001FB5AC85|nr:uncharacterized protein LOC125028303 [Penaeus chinensis]
MKGLVLSLALCVLAATSVSAREEDNLRFLAKYTTTTAIVLSTLTSTVPYTCYNNLNDQVCLGRRLRRLVKMEDLEAEHSESMSLDGSQGDSVAELDELERDVRAAGDEDDESARDGRVALVVWSTSSSTYTITSKSTNSSTTFSLSYYCTAVGAPMAPAC